MNALVSQFGKFLAPTRRCISTYGRPLFAEFKEIEDIDPFPAEESQRQNNEKCVNEITLIGRVGKDPVLVTSAYSDRTFVRFPFATSYKRGETEKHTDWHDIVAFKDTMREYVLKSIGKGDRLFLKGKLSYAKPPDGTLKDQKARILLNEIVILKRKREGKERESNLDI